MFFMEMVLTVRQYFVVYKRFFWMIHIAPVNCKFVYKLTPLYTF